MKKSKLILAIAGLVLSIASAIFAYFEFQKDRSKKPGLANKGPAKPPPGPGKMPREESLARAREALAAKRARAKEEKEQAVELQNENGSKITIGEDGLKVENTRADQAEIDKMNAELEKIITD